MSFQNECDSKLPLERKDELTPRTLGILELKHEIRQRHERLESTGWKAQHRTHSTGQTHSTGHAMRGLEAAVDSF